MVATVAEEGSTAEEGFVLVGATLLMEVDTTTAAITAVAMVGAAAIGDTLATGTDGDLVLALAGDPTGLLTRMLTVMVPGGALLTTITHALILIILRPPAHMPIHIHIPTTAVVPHKILAGTVTTTLRLNYRALLHRPNLLALLL
jgi:hypothetical protein